MMHYEYDDDTGKHKQRLERVMSPCRLFTVEFKKKKQSKALTLKLKTKRIYSLLMVIVFR